MFFTEIIIHYSNNKVLKKWANGKVFNIMPSAQFFSQHNWSLVVLGHCPLFVMIKFQDKFASLQQLNSANSWDKFQICCINMYLRRFLVNFVVFHMFLWILWLCNHAKYQTPWYYELRHLHYTNWQLQICIWRLYFSSWSSKGKPRLFLISSPE